MRVVFMGTPDFSVTALDALVQAGHEIAMVYSQPPRRAGRGKKLVKTAVHQRAEALGLSVRTPLNFKDPADREGFAALNADIAVVVAYGLILPQEILDAPARGCLNIHASLLPKWRGAAPIHRAIMAGDMQTGVCIMQMDAGLDTGGVLMRATLDIGPQETTAELHDRLAVLGADLIVKTVAQLDALVAVPQESGSTYAKKIDKSEARLDWLMPAEQVSRLVRGLSPFPGAWTDILGVRVKILNCEIVDQTGPAGQVLDDALTIACGRQAIRPLRVQKAGKPALDMGDFLRGFPVPAGTKLG